MLKTCFGCCPLRIGVSVIAFANMIWNLAEMAKHYIYRYYNYDRHIVDHNNGNHSSNSNDSNNTIYDDADNDYSNWTEFMEVKPLMSEIFMDYLFMVTFGWIVLELISNIYLKQSTFKHAPHKIYVWLVAYYGNLAFMSVHLLHNVIHMIKYPDSSKEFTVYRMKIIRHLMMKLMYIAIIGFEIIVIHSFYILEKNAMLNDLVQLKWKYVSRGNVVSEGIDYTTSSNFKAETSRQTQEGSTIPPYISNILQNN